MADDLIVEQRGAVLLVTLNREDRMNALTREIHERLPATWQALHRDRSVRAIVITGTGTRAFCAGMDLRDLSENGHRPTHPEFRHHLKQTPMQNDVWLPTIVAVNGVCTGSGLHFVADADVVIASTNASFLDTHVDVGQVSAIEPITLAPRIGVGNARRMVVLGRAGRIGADDALRISLVDEVVEPERLLDRALELAEAAASGSPAAIEASKRAVLGALELPMAEAAQRGWELMLEFREHPDNAEGARAFAERRPPNWQ
jgi:enoyl-CoA hydratase/carnithine racemase